MTNYLFIFGFETPSMIKSNQEHDSDFEISQAVFIESASKELAFQYGRVIANKFLQALFKNEAAKPNVDDYAHWIDESPSNTYQIDDLNSIARVHDGDDEIASRVVAAWVKST